MTKTIKLSAAALALCLSGMTAPASAEDTLTTRAATALGHAIAAQGNAALVEIREELKRDLLKTLQPLLPKPAQDTLAPTAVPAPARG